MTSIPDSTSARARGLYDGALVWDMVLPIHSDVGNGFDLLERYTAAGFGFVSFTIAGDDVGIAGATQRLASVRRQLVDNSHRYVFVQNADDITRARQEGKLAVSLHFEGTRCLDRDAQMLEVYYALGVRHTLLAFNQSNSAASGCAEADDAGLTRFGRRVVNEMARLGMVLDLSHTGYRSTMQALEMSQGPCIFSHSNAYAVHPHYRNLREDQIDACARGGGVIGVSGSGDYLGIPEGRKDSATLIERAADHVMYYCERVGARHVGIGLDYVRSPEMLEQFYIGAKPDEWPENGGKPWGPFVFLQPEDALPLVERLLQRGLSDADVLGILGGNFERVMREVWK